MDIVAPERTGDNLTPKKWREGWIDLSRLKNNKQKERFYAVPDPATMRITPPCFTGNLFAKNYYLKSRGSATRYIFVCKDIRKNVPARTTNKKRLRIPPRSGKQWHNIGKPGILTGCRSKIFFVHPALSLRPFYTAVSAGCRLPHFSK